MARPHVTAVLRGHRSPHAPRSLWLQQALAAEDEAWRSTQMLEGSHTTDVAIVGGGYAGLWTAIRIKQLDPAAEVMVVEADLCGSGASGRNGGIAVGWWWRLPLLERQCGSSAAAALMRGSLHGIDDVEELLRDEGLGQTFRRDGWYWTATNDSQLGSWDAAVEVAGRLGLPALEPVEPHELAARLGSDVHRAGILDRTSATVQPAVLARALRKVALRLGVEIYEGSTVTRVKGGRPARLKTAAGRVEAGAVVLAANAWMAHLPTFRRRIMQVSSDMVATEPIPDRLREMGWTDGSSWSDSRMCVDYAQATPDGRIAMGRGGGTLAFGGRLGPAFGQSRAQTRLVVADLRRVHPELADVAITHAWAGPIDRATSGLPWCDRLEGDSTVTFVAGFSGTGIAPTALLGRVTASTVLERDDEWRALGATLRQLQPGTSLPPEPIRFLGGQLVKRAVARKELAEDADRRPSRAMTAMAGLVPMPVPPATPVNDTHVGVRADQPTVP